MVSGDHHDGSIDYSWQPSEHAISYNFFQHPTRHGRDTIVVSHPTAPFVGTLAADEPWSSDLMQKAAHAFLMDLSAKLNKYWDIEEIGLPTGWLKALNPETPHPYFRWLVIEPPFLDDDEGSNATLMSRLLTRDPSPEDGNGEPKDNTVILVAAERLPDGKGGHATNSDFGLSVVMHLASEGEKKRISISSMTAHLPYGPYIMLLQLQPGDVASDELEFLRSVFHKAFPHLSDDRQFPFFNVLQEAFVKGDPEIAAALQLQPGLTYEKMRLYKTLDDTGRLPPVALEVRGKGLETFSGGKQFTPYGFIATVGFKSTDSGFVAKVKLVSKAPLVANARAPTPGRARVFEQDPASWRDLDDLHGVATPYNRHLRRPTRSEEELDRFRRLVAIGDTANKALETGDFVVRNCPHFVYTDPDNNNVRRVNLPTGVWPPVRANDHSAISAYWNCAQMFGVMHGFGIDVDAYFSSAERPIDVYYRSGISPRTHKNGLTINAQVLLRDEDGVVRFLECPGCSIEVHLALANLSHRARWVPDASAPTWAEPLGIATSERWMWHEFGHVLIAASLGSLEFQFAHSAGDGMAAVWADPFSRLADPRDTAELFRGYTLPWVFVTRRHDRCVLYGWSWSGTFQRPVTEAPDDLRGNLKGYLSEQILSSTLFRLYRILGGDTVDVEDGGPDYETRETASLVTLYLIMRGIESFAMPPARGEELETAMIEADTGLTTPLALTLHTGTNHNWTGGMAHKVVRWAYEAQGMHWPVDGPPRNEPGPPPPVDIYIDDRRPREEQTEGIDVPHGPGGYVPVSLDWAGEPLWQMDNIDDLAIIVRNRGTVPATNVALRAWFGFVDGNPHTRGWDRTAAITWLGPFGIMPAAATIDVGGAAEFALAEAIPASPLAAPTRLLFLIEATCPDDRANSDPAAGRPCAVTDLPPPMPREVADLVANDNNLGLMMFDLT